MTSSVSLWNTPNAIDESSSVTERERPRETSADGTGRDPELDEGSARPGKCCGQKGVVYKDPDYLEIKNLNEIPSWLGPCHLAAAVCQTMQALFLFAFATQVNIKWCLYSNYPDIEANDVSETDIYAVPGSVDLGCYNITWYAGIFILMSGFAHSLHRIPRYRRLYDYYIERHQSPMRWVEYGFSCPLMRVHIAQVAGVTDLFTLILIFFLTQCVMYFALLYEAMNAKNRADGYKQNHLAFSFAVVPNLVTWGVVFTYFAKGFGRADAPLTFSIVLILFFLECTFPLVFALQWLKVGPFKDYLMGEFAFIVMSFTTKTFLAWVTLIGADAFTR